jgi:recombination associated protein RdgC
LGQLKTDAKHRTRKEFPKAVPPVRFLREIRTSENTDFELGDEYELQDADKEGGIVRCRRQDPFSEEIQSHLEAGKQVTKLALTWRERLEFIVTEELVVKRLRFTDALKQEMDEEHEDPVVQFDSDFAFMSGELSLFIKALIDAFGGESEAEPV